MSKDVKFRLASLLLCGVAVTVAYGPTKTEAMMAATANRFAETLDRFQKPRTVFNFGSPSRTKWHYFPEGDFTQEYGHPRSGLALRDMDPKQRHLAYALLSTGLSKEGYLKAINVMTLEEIVRVIENDMTGHRDADNFHFTIFGEPSLTGTWGWRVEGHHLSLHYTIRNGELISSSPTFFGANPHEVPQGPHQGMRALADEEDLAVALLTSLDPQQKKQVIIDDVATEDIVTRAEARAKLEGEPRGLPASKMSEKQYEMLLSLIEEYASNMPPEVAAQRMKAAQEAPRGQLFFAWAGRLDRPKAQPIPLGTWTTGNREPNGNYYRVQAPKFLIEYDNTQNRSNHSHSVWRDFDGDFGLDVLAVHHALYDHGLAGRERFSAEMKK